MPWLAAGFFIPIYGILMRNDIVACARGWIGTRFHHQGRLKKSASHKGGVDCLGLLAGVADEMQFRHTDGTALAAQDETFYSHYPDTRRLQEKLAELMREIPVGGIEAGDILLLSIDNNPQHLAIVGHVESGLSIIHAYAPARSVVEHAIDAWWQQRIVAAFRII